MTTPQQRLLNNASKTSIDDDADDDAKVQNTKSQTEAVLGPKFENLIQKMHTNVKYCVLFGPCCNHSSACSHLCWQPEPGLMHHAPEKLVNLAGQKLNAMVSEESINRSPNSLRRVSQRSATNGFGSHRDKLAACSEMRPPSLCVVAWLRGSLDAAAWCEASGTLRYMISYMIS